MSAATDERTASRSELRGHIDHLSSDGASGWLCDLAQHHRRLSVEALVDGQVVVTTVADAYRPDLKELGKSDGHSGFHLEFPLSCFDGKAHDVTLRVRETGAFITQQPVTLSFPTKPIMRKVVGLLEHVDTSLFVSGWALSAGKDTPARVVVLVNGAKVVSKDTNLLRPDLLIAGLPSSRAGFKISIPKEAITCLENEIEVTVDGEQLPGSPKQLSLTSLVAARSSKYAS